VGAHVRVDLFDKPLGRWGRFAGDILSRGLVIWATFYLCRRAWAKMFDAVTYGETTNMLQLPLWPAYAAVFAGMALSAFVMAAQIAALLTGWNPDHD
jgi:TRAP-type C4-dicarboxylate transport system permease small subunit